MSRDKLLARLREVIAEPVPLPGGGRTAERHRRLFAVGREDLSLARLVEAHWDALAILAEAGREPKAGAIYGVWAAEAPDKSLRMEQFALSGTKSFCSGAGIVDRALLTVREPKALLLDVDLRGREDALGFDDSGWKTSAFAETKTAVATFRSLAVNAEDVVGTAGYFLTRPGFWHGACGPAACWAGGSAGLLDWAVKQRRDDPHTLAHLGAMCAALWSMKGCLESAGHEIDEDPNDFDSAKRRALMLRHVVEQDCTDILRRFARAYGPHPLAMEERIAARYQELELYLRQCHAERDLEVLGAMIHRDGVLWYSSGEAHSNS